MNGPFPHRRSPFIAWALPLLALAICAVAALALHLAAAPAHSGLAGLTFEADSDGAGAAAIGWRRHMGARRLIVTSVKSGGLAEAAGIRAGDVIERIDGMEIHSVDDVDRTLAQHPAQTVHLLLGRSGTMLDTQLPSRNDPVR